MKYFSFLFSTCFIPFIFSTQKAVAERVPGERRLKLMTSHVYRHHGASKAWQNDRSCLQYVLTNKLVRRCFALHNRCGWCRGTEQPTEKRETTAPHLDQWGPSGPLIPNWTKETGRRHVWQWQAGTYEDLQSTTFVKIAPFPHFSGVVQWIRFVIFDILF